MDLHNKNILVAGGLGSIGQAIINSLQKEANIYIFDKTPHLDIPNYFSVDVTDESSVEKALQQIDQIDILVNCAGEIYSEPILNILKKKRHSKKNWDRVINNNLNSCFVMSTQIAQKMMMTRTKGIIINFSSISAQGNIGQVAYSSAKAGVEAITKVLAKELGLLNIRVCAIAPGFINTESTKKSLSPAMIDSWTKQIPLHRLGEATEIISTVRYIIECDYISGCIIPVNGALTV